MPKRKNIRERGKISFSRAFKEFEKGDLAGVVIEQSITHSFPNRIQGRTGVVLGKRGNAFLVEVKDLNKPKIFIVNPIHLKKIKKGGKKNDKE